MRYKIRLIALLHTIFGRQILYYSNTTSTAVSNLTVLSSITDKINEHQQSFLG